MQQCSFMNLFYIAVLFAGVVKCQVWGEAFSAADGAAKVSPYQFECFGDVTAWPKNEVFEPITVTCSDNSKAQLCRCRRFSNYTFPPGTCGNDASPVMVSGAYCERPQCLPGQIARITIPAYPVQGKCCPTYECGFPRKPENDFQCYKPNMKATTSYKSVTAICADGTNSTFCECDSEFYDVPASACAGSAIATIFSESLCPAPPKCREGYNLKTYFAYPYRGQCCPSYTCLQFNTEYDCGNLTFKRDGNFGSVTIFCEDGTSQSSCGVCNPKEICPGSKFKNSFGVGCAMFQCPQGYDQVVEKVADPQSGVCCPARKCVPGRRAWNEQKCWIFSDGNSSKYEKIEATCEEGTKLSYCSCSPGSGYDYPKRACLGVASFPVQKKIVKCLDPPVCGQGFTLVLEAPAFPDLDICCPTFSCREIFGQNSQIGQQGISLPIPRSDKLNDVPTATSEKVPGFAIAMIFFAVVALISLISLAIFLGIKLRAK